MSNIVSAPCDPTWTFANINRRENTMAAYPAYPWLDASIEVLIGEPRGTAHVDAIVSRLRRWNVKDPKNTIVRTLNSYCSDASDFRKGNENLDLFQRVAPNTFRLRSYPARPETRMTRKAAEAAEIERLLAQLGLTFKPATTRPAATEKGEPRMSEVVTKRFLMDKISKRMSEEPGVSAGMFWTGLIHIARQGSGPNWCLQFNPAEVPPGYERAWNSIRHEFEDRYELAEQE